MTSASFDTYQSLHRNGRLYLPSDHSAGQMFEYALHITLRVLYILECTAEGRVQVWPGC